MELKRNSDPMMLSRPRVTKIRRLSTPLAMESLNPILKLTVSPTTQIVETEMPPPPLRPNRQHEQKADASYVPRRDKPEDWI